MSAFAFLCRCDYMSKVCEDWTVDMFAFLLLPVNCSAWRAVVQAHISGDVWVSSTALEVLYITGLFSTAVTLVTTETNGYRLPALVVLCSSDSPPGLGDTGPPLHYLVAYVDQGDQDQQPYA